MLRGDHLREKSKRRTYDAGNYIGPCRPGFGSAICTLAVSAGLPLIANASPDTDVEGSASFSWRPAITSDFETFVLPFAVYRAVPPKLWRRGDRRVFTCGGILQCALGVDLAHFATTAYCHTGWRSLPLVHSRFARRAIYGVDSTSYSPSCLE